MVFLSGAQRIGPAVPQEINPIDNIMGWIHLLISGNITGQGLPL
jgi:hypothetical protein